MQIKSRNNFGHLLNAMELLGHGVEVGVQAGEFSKIIRSSWNGKFLHLVDRWKHDPNYVDIANVSDDDQKNLYLQVVSMFADDPSVSIHRMDSLVAAESFPDNYFDWVYIDADHSYEGCKADLNAWYPKLKEHGIFAGHDFIDGNYNAGNFGVKSAVEEFLLDKNVQLNLTSGDYLNSWYFEKSSVAVNKDIAEIHNITDSNPDSLIDEAREFQERKDYKAALSKLNLAESMFNGHLSSPQNANFASAFFSLKGYNYLGDRDYDKAKECFEKALNLNPNSSEACSGLGDLFVLNGDNEHAKIMYEWAIKNNPYNNYPKEALEKINFSPAIIQNFIPVEDENKHDASEIRVVLEKILASIFELFNLKEFDEALFALNKNEQLFYSQFRDGGNNDIVSAYENMKGFVYLGLDQIENAHSSFETALNLNPDSSQSSAGLGEVFYLQGEDEKAKNMFEWSLRNEPNNLFAKAGLEKVNKLLQQSQEDPSTEDNVSDKQKEEKIREVLEKILNAAYEIFNLKKFHEALKALDDNQQLFYSQYREGEHNDIISAFENLKGFIYLGLNENDNARVSFEMALHLNPDSSQACAGLGEVFYLQSEDEKAKKMFEWSLKNEPGNFFALAGLEKVNELLELKQDHTFNA
ncbi:MAG: tetratricopeptide repeat protein [Ignavibacteriaceae bacterium]